MSRILLLRAAIIIAAFCAMVTVLGNWYDYVRHYGLFGPY